MKIVGIDPGTTGAIALISTMASEAAGAAVWDLEAVRIGSVNILSPQRLRDRLVQLGPIDHIFVEEVHANAMSYKSNFTLGAALGVILGVCAALDRPVTRIKPKEWQAAVGVSQVPAATRKNTHRQRAQELWPGLVDDLKLVKHHNRADALLIAEAGRKTL